MAHSADHTKGQREGTQEGQAPRTLFEQEAGHARALVPWKRHRAVLLSPLQLKGKAQSTC